MCEEEKLQLTKEEAMEVIERMPYLQIIKAPSDKVRYEFYDTALSSKDVIEWIRIIKTVYIRRASKRLTREDGRVELLAKKRLHRVLSDALGLSVEELEPFIKKILEEEL